MPKGFTGGQRANAMTRPNSRGVTLARLPTGRKPPGPEEGGTRKKPSPAYRAGLGSRELHFPLGCGDGGSHPPYRVATLSGQPNHGATWQKANDLSPGYREVVQCKASQGTKGAGNVFA